MIVIQFFSMSIYNKFLECTAGGFEKWGRVKVGMFSGRRGEAERSIATLRKQTHLIFSHVFVIRWSVL